jgi:soluble lytic murein transglycosylase
MEDAQSPAGALGLMQVMPATGRETAQTLGLKKFYTSHLLQADTNVPIGTEYLRRMYDRFNRNLVLATAAYNAGPGNVKKWLPSSGCIDPEIWIEKIPFTETRKYVQRILYYASIYDWRLGREIIPVRERMAAVPAAPDRLVAGLSCTGQLLSVNLASP